MRIPNCEKETIITYNEADRNAVVYTCNPAMKRKLKALSESRPDDCKFMRTYPDETAVEFEVPKKWVKVSPPRFVSDETRAAMAERFKNARLAHSDPMNTVDSVVNEDKE